MESVQIRSYFWSLFFCILFEYRKIRTRSNYVFGHFSRSEFPLVCWSRATNSFSLFLCLLLLFYFISLKKTNKKINDNKIYNNKELKQKLQQNLKEETKKETKKNKMNNEKNSQKVTKSKSKKPKK